MEKVNGKLVTFIGIVILVVIIAVFGFVFWQPKAEFIQGEAEATEVRISGKVPGRIEEFRVNEGVRCIKAIPWLYSTVPK